MVFSGGRGSKPKLAFKSQQEGYRLFSFLLTQKLCEPAFQNKQENFDIKTRHSLPICNLHLTWFVSILFMQVSKGQVFTCKVNFYRSQDLFLKLRETFKYKFSFLEHRCKLFRDLLCDASFLSTYIFYILHIQKISILPHTRDWNFQGVGGSVRPKNLKKSVKLYWNFQRGWGS